MSSEQTQGNTTSSKPITAAFDLQTKIRVIIQEVLAATMRKISQFNQKVETFQKFFFTYTQRVNDIDEKGKNNQQAFTRLFQTVIKNKQSNESELIKLQQRIQQLKLQKTRMSEQIRQINKKINTINRQNESINTEFSNTKKKFLQYSELMSGLKQEVAWKITRYVQQTAQINTKIQINNQEIKKEYFNINLALEKNKEKYQEIISARDRQESMNQMFKENLEEMEITLKEKVDIIGGLNKKLDDMDTALYAKIKLTESKLERRIDDLSESNQKIQKSISKVDGFSGILDEIRDDSEKVRRQLMKKFEETDQKHSDRIEKEVLTLNMNILNYEKTTDKKIRSITEAHQKNVQFFNQKMQYLKIEIQSEISSKATKMLQQKSKTQSSVSNSALQQVQQKINKLTLETKKQINKMENALKQVKLEVKHQVEDMKEAVQTRITSTVKAIEESSGSGVSPEFVQAINEKIQKIKDGVELRLVEFVKEIAQQNLRVSAVQTMKDETSVKFNALTKQSQQKFTQLEQKISGKVQRVLYTVTKMRGDAIIRNQFTDKQIKQLKRISESAGRDISTVLKLFPALGECVNVMMCLIFDAEYQHAKIIQQNLPALNKSTMKFQNLVEGVLYEYMQKKKPGYITYRHKEQKKIDIVKATFNGYIKIWQQLFDNDFKNKQDYIPKSFYKKYVQKNIGTPRDSRSPNKQSSNPTNIQYRDANSKEKERELASDGSRNVMRNSIDYNSQGSSDNMNRSFHIRKKKITTIRSKDDLIMVVQEDAKQQK